MTFNINAQVRLLPPSNAAQIAAQLRSQLQNISATVSVRVPPRAQQQLRTVNQGLKKTSAGAKEAGNSISDFGKQAALAGKRFFAFSIATTAILRFAGALKDASKEAISFQRELIKISQVTGNTLSLLKGLTGEITRLSTTLGTNSTQLLKASRILAQTGLTAKQTEVALQALAKSDLAPTFENIINTTEGSIAIFRQFGIEANELEASLGSVNAVSGKFAVESGDIITAVRRTGGAFAAAGGSLEELIALFTSVRATTRESAQSIATGFRTIFTRLQRVRTQNFLGTLGIDLQNLEGQFVGPYKAVQRLSFALRNLPSTDPRFAQIIEELGGFRQVSKVIPLIQQFGTAQKALSVALGGTNSLTEDAETAQQALAVQIQKTREEFVAMIRAFTDSSAFQGTIRLVLKLANALIKVASALEPLAPLIGLLGTLSVFRLLPGAYKGFREVGGFGLTGLKGQHTGGPVKHYASGGLVPGVGNKDTVPAKLTPGEYVLRKSAVQKIGEENLQHLNFGGVVLFGDNPNQPGKDKTLQGTTLKRNITSLLQEKNILPTEYQLQYKKKDEIPDLKGYYGVVQHEVAKDVRTSILTDLREAGTKAAKTLAPKFGSKPGEVITNEEFIVNEDSMLGNLFENAILRLGPPYDTKEEIKNSRRMDFPFGIPGSLQSVVNNGGRLKGVPVDAKKSMRAAESNKEGIPRKFQGYIAEKLAFQPQTTIEGFSLKKIEQAPNRQSGGMIDVPNAILTPGEYVIGKEDAARIGQNKLDYINRTGNIPGFARGGPYGQAFKPRFRSRGSTKGEVTQADVGRKKQYYYQLLDFLEKGQTQGLLSSEDQQLLISLRARVKGLRMSRGPRYARRMWGGNKGGAFGVVGHKRKSYAIGGPVGVIGGDIGFQKGGTFGHIKPTAYQTGGTVGRIGYQTGGVVGGTGLGNFASIGLAVAAAGQLASTFQGLNSTVDKAINFMSSVGAQFFLLKTAISTTSDYFNQYGKKIEAADKRRQQLKQERAELVPKRQAAIDARATLQQRAAQLPPGRKRDILQRGVGKLDTRIDTQRQILRANTQQRWSQRQLIKTNERLQHQTQNTAYVLGALGAIATTAGQKLEEAGRRAIEAGRGTGTFIAGKAVSGAARGSVFGILAGQAVGGPMGAVLGGAAGAIGGAAYGLHTGKQEAYDLQVLTEFNKDLSETGRIFKSLSDGLTIYDLQQARLISSINDAGQSLNTVSVDAAQNIKSNFKSQIDSYDKLFKTIAESSDSFEDFQETLGSDTISNFVDLVGSSTNEFRRSFTSYIHELQKGKKAQLEASNTAERFANNIRNMVNLGRAFNDVTLRMKNFSNTVGTLIAFAEGSAGNFRVTDTSERVADPSKFFDDKEFERIIGTNIIQNEALQSRNRGSTDVIGEEFGRNVLDAQRASQELPGILLNLRNSIGSFDGNQAVEVLVSQFDDAGDLVQNAIRVAADNILGGEGKEEKLIKAIQNDLVGTTDKLGKELKKQFEIAAQIVKANNEEKNRRLAFVDKLTALTQQEIDARDQALVAQQNFEDIRAKARNRPTNLNALQEVEDRRRANLGVAGGPAEVAVRLQEAQNKLRQLQIKYDKQKLKSDDKLLKQQEKYKNVILKSQNALDFFADASERSAIILERIDRERQKVDFQRGLIERAAGAETPEENRTFALELQYSRLAAATGTLKFVPPEFRREVLSLFKDLGEDVEPFGEGTGSGKDIFNRLLTDFAASIPGIPPDLVKNIVEGTTSDIEKYNNVLEGILKEANTAFEAKVTSVGDIIEKLRETLNDSIGEFNTKLTSLIARQQLVEQKRRLAGEEGKFTKFNVAIQNLNEFTRRFGGMEGTPEEREQRARQFGRNLPELREVALAQQKRQQLGDFIDEFSQLQYEAPVGARVQFPSVIDFPQNLVPPESISEKLLQEAQFEPTSEAPRLTEQVVGDKIDKLGNILLTQTGDQDVTDQFRDALRTLTRGSFDSDEGQEYIGSMKFQRFVIEALKGTTDSLRKRFANLGDKVSDLETNLGFELKPELLSQLIDEEEFKKINQQFSTFKDLGDNLNELSLQLLKFSTAVSTTLTNIRDLEKQAGTQPSTEEEDRQRGGFIKLNQGGIVPGVGNKDTVKALLTPGEVVLPKQTDNKVAIINKLAQQTGGTIPDVRSVVEQRPSVMLAQQTGGTIPDVRSVVEQRPSVMLAQQTGGTIPDVRSVVEQRPSVMLAQQTGGTIPDVRSVVEQRPSVMLAQQTGGTIPDVRSVVEQRPSVMLAQQTGGTIPDVRSVVEQRPSVMLAQQTGGTIPDVRSVVEQRPSVMLAQQTGGTIPDVRSVVEQRPSVMLAQQTGGTIPDVRSVVEQRPSVMLAQQTGGTIPDVRSVVEQRPSVMLAQQTGGTIPDVRSVVEQRPSVMLAQQTGGTIPDVRSVVEQRPSVMLAQQTGGTIPDVRSVVEQRPSVMLAQQTGGTIPDVRSVVEQRPSVMLAQQTGGTIPDVRSVVEQRPSVMLAQQTGGTIPDVRSVVEQRPSVMLAQQTGGTIPDVRSVVEQRPSVMLAQQTGGTIPDVRSVVEQRPSVMLAQQTGGTIPDVRSVVEQRPSVMLAQQTGGTIPDVRSVVEQRPSVMLAQQTGGTIPDVRSVVEQRPSVMLAQQTGGTIPDVRSVVEQRPSVMLAQQTGGTIPDVRSVVEQRPSVMLAQQTGGTIPDVRSVVEQRPSVMLAQQTGGTIPDVRFSKTPDVFHQSTDSIINKNILFKQTGGIIGNTDLTYLPKRLEEEETIKRRRQKRLKERYRRLGRKRDYQPLTEEQKEDRADYFGRLAKAKAQGRTTFDLYKEEKLGEAKEFVTGVAGKAKDYVTGKFGAVKDVVQPYLQVPQQIVSKPLPTVEDSATDIGSRLLTPQKETSATDLLPQYSMGMGTFADLPKISDERKQSYSSQRLHRIAIEHLVRSGEVTYDNVYKYFRGRADDTGYNKDLQYAKTILRDVNREAEESKSPTQRKIEEVIVGGVRSTLGGVASGIDYIDKRSRGIADISDNTIDNIRDKARYRMFKSNDKDLPLVKRLYHAGELTQKSYDNITQDVLFDKRLKMSGGKETYRKEKTDIPVVREVQDFAQFLIDVATPKALEKHVQIPKIEVERGSAVGMMSTIFDIGKGGANLAVNTRTIPGLLAGMTLSEQIDSGYAQGAMFGAGDATEFALSAPFIGGAFKLVGKAAKFVSPGGKLAKAVYNQSASVRRGVNVARAPSREIPGFTTPTAYAQRATGLNKTQKSIQYATQVTDTVSKFIAQTKQNVGRTFDVADDFVQRYSAPIETDIAKGVKYPIDLAKTIPKTLINKTKLVDKFSKAKESIDNIGGYSRNILQNILKPTSKTPYDFSANKLGSGINLGGPKGPTVTQVARPTLPKSTSGNVLQSGVNLGGPQPKQAKGFFRRLIDRQTLNPTKKPKVSSTFLNRQKAAKAANVKSDTPTGKVMQEAAQPDKTRGILLAKIKNKLVNTTRAIKQKIIQGKETVRLADRVINPGERFLPTRFLIQKRTFDFVKKHNIPKKLLPKGTMLDEKIFDQIVTSSPKLKDPLAFYRPKSGIMHFSPKKPIPINAVDHEIAHAIHNALPKWGDPATMAKFEKIYQPIFKRIQKVAKPEVIKNVDSPKEMFALITQNADTAPNTFNRMRRLFEFQTGAMVPGVGSGDKIRAMLEPGEYVLNRNAVKAVGVNTLDRVNKQHSRFQTGGAVGMQEGGSTISMAMPDLSLLNETIQKFGNKVDLLAESVNSINGMEIQLIASHKVEVIINGAQVMQGLMPSIQNMIVAETNKAINSMLKTKFPDVGTME